MKKDTSGPNLFLGDAAAICDPLVGGERCLS